MSEQQTDWHQVKIGELLTEHSERSTSSNQHEVLSVTKDGIFSQREYFKKQIASEDNSGYKVVRRGDVVFSAMNLWMGSIDVVKDQEIGIVSPAYITMRPTEGLIDTGFLGYFLRGDEMRKKYVQHSQQGASIVRRNLNKDDLLDEEVCIPPLPEQKKIAEILSGIDKTISNELRAIAKTETILIGIFADLDLIASSGKTAILGETARVQNGYAFQSSTFSEDPGDIPLVRISNITGGIVDTSKSKRIPRSLVPSDEYKVRKGDILIAMSGATTGKIGEYQEDIPCLLNQRVGKFEFLQGEESAFFTSQLLLSGFLESRILAKAAGGAQPNISGKGIEEIEVPLPDAADQLKYGSAIQKLLAIKSRRRFLVEKYGQLKQAMAADLLSGRTRVSV